MAKIYGKLAASYEASDRERYKELLEESYPQIGSFGDKARGEQLTPEEKKLVPEFLALLYKANSLLTKEEDYYFRWTSLFIYSYDFYAELDKAAFEREYVFPLFETNLQSEPRSIISATRLVINHEDELSDNFAGFLTDMLEKYKDDRKLFEFISSADINYNGAYIDIEMPPEELAELTRTLVKDLNNEYVMVRAASAMVLGNIYAATLGEGLTPSAPELLEMITEKEITSPGIAAPYFTAFEYDDIEKFEDVHSVNFKTWAQELIDRTELAEPNLAPFCAEFPDHAKKFLD